jgi:hypothetical protein
MKNQHTKIILIFFLFLVIVSCVYSQDKEQIKLVSLEKPQGEYGPIGLKVFIPWMNGSIEIRFPETLDSEEGIYFIDHEHSDMLHIL